MGFEVATERAVCSRCGKAYGKRSGFFPVSYAATYRGVGYLPICKSCLEAMYDTYLAQTDDPKAVVRQMCRKLDLFWSENVYEKIEKKAGVRSMMTKYLARINTDFYAGKSYDDTLRLEGTLWHGITVPAAAPEEEQPAEPEKVIEEDPEPEEPKVKLEDIPENIINFWGAGYENNPEMYLLLEQRRQYWIDNLPEGIEMDIGTEAVIRQICSLELDINRDRAAGKNVEKMQTALAGLLNNTNLKPKQKKADDVSAETQNTPLGVWLYRYENERPLPPTPDELKDRNRILRYIFVWMGHVLKMLGKKNRYSEIYEEEMARLRVERPEYDGDDDELLDTVFAEEAVKDE